MSNVMFKISSKDKEWITEESRKNDLAVKFIETDGLVGGSEWLNVMLPLEVISIPYIAKIIMKIIDMYGPAKISCGQMVVDKVPQKDVLKVLDKMVNIQNKERNK